MQVQFFIFASSVIEGFNGTIFAYGQTGSGKTYSITGSPKNYNDRGIIPRSIQHIFGYLEKVSSENYSLHISYMEIYNEIGYDLLNPKQHNTAMRLEELPRVILLEDGKGEAHIRNLSILPVATEQEAMRLLFLGDTNRTIAETPMNEYSSRSHCIFTIYISARYEKSCNIRFSKVHLVDLAGSERVCKSKVSGVTLNEAKSINLSLHYLEQVILALSEEKRPHIPYRNSLMTYMLKDSLSGNCLTVMLATLNITKYNMLETISTCKFAQRVALVKMEAIINESVDLHQETKYLKNKIEDLEKQIRLMSNCSIKEDLTNSQVRKCEKEVKIFLNDSSNCTFLKVDADMQQIQHCFKLLKKEITYLKEINLTQESQTNQIHVHLQKQEDTIKIKDEKIDKLKTLLQDKNSNININSDFPQDKNHLFQIFMSYPEHVTEVEHFNKTLTIKYDMAKMYADAIEQCQNNIVYIRIKNKQVQSDEDKNQTQNDLKEQQCIYRNAIIALKDLKSETTHLKYGLERAELKLRQKFEFWLQKLNNSSNSLNCNENLNHNKLNNCFSCSNCCCKSDNEILNNSNICKNENGYLLDKNVTTINNGSCKEQFLNGTVINDDLHECSINPYNNIYSINKEFANFYEENGFKNIVTSEDFPKTRCDMMDFRKEPKCKNCNNCSEISKDKNSFSNILDFVENMTKSDLINNKNSKFENLTTREVATSFNNIYDNEHNCSNIDCFKEFQKTSTIFEIDKSEEVNENLENSTNLDTFQVSDTQEFMEFIKTISLTGEKEVDEEIINFYRNKFM